MTKLSAHFLRLSCLFMLMLSQMVYGCPPDASEGVQVEHVRELGFGFRNVTLTKPTPWELGHFEFLYYRDKSLCQLGECSVSPSGNHAIFQDGPSGNLFLYRRVDGRQIQLTEHFVALVRKFNWHEDTGTVEVIFETGKSEEYSIESPVLDVEP